MPTFVPLDFTEYPPDEMLRRAAEFRADLQRRRTVRDFSPRPVARGILDECLRAAATSPSGANMQPWHFVVVSDPALKRQIREAAEAEEREFYERRAPKECGWRRSRRWGPTPTSRFSRRRRTSS